MLYAWHKRDFYSLPLCLREIYTAFLCVSERFLQPPFVSQRNFYSLPLCLRKIATAFLCVSYNIARPHWLHLLYSAVVLRSYIAFLYVWMADHIWQLDIVLTFWCWPFQEEFVADIARIIRYNMELKDDKSMSHLARAGVAVRTIFVKVCIHTYALFTHPISSLVSYTLLDKWKY